MLDVRLVGGLALSHEGVALALPRSRRARELLAWLAVHPGMHPRSDVAARFWPDVLDESARTSLRAGLTELRQSLGPAAPALAATRQAVGLDPARARVDVHAADSPQELCELGPAELLTGIDGEWVLDARDRHRARMAQAYETLAAQAERDGNFERAIELSRRRVELDLLDEDSTRALMRRLAAAGQRAGAFAVHERLAGRLRADLGLAPSPETRALVAELRSTPAAALPVSAEPFAGREEELRRLHEILAQTAGQGSRRLVLVTGEPGIGKSRLVSRFCEQVTAAVALGRCWEEPLEAFEPFPALLRALGSDPMAALTAAAAGERARLFDAVDELIAERASARPVVVVLEDLHWAQPPALALLRALLASHRAAPLLVLATYRDTELGRSVALTGALGELRGERVALRGLTANDVADLAQQTLGDAGASEAIHRRTAGNPLFVEEVLRALARGDDAAHHVPDSIRHAVAGRQARLDAHADELLQAAAVLGPICDPHLLGEVSGLERPDASLAELLRSGLLQATDDGRVQFPHALVRDAIHDDVNVLRRTRLHRRAAEALTARGEEAHLTEIARHRAHAISPTDARETADLLARAGRRSVAQLAYEEGARWFAHAEEALAIAGAPPDPELQLAGGEALMRAGEVAQARDLLKRAAASARVTGDAPLLARAALGAGGLPTAIRPIDTDYAALMEDALERLGDGEPALRARLLSRLAVECFYDSRERSDRLGEAAVEVAAAAGDAGAVAATLNARHLTLWRPDRLPERLATVDAMHTAALKAGDRVLELQALNWRVTDLWEAGDLVEWQRAVAQHRALAVELRLPAFRWYDPLWAATDAVRTDRGPQARSLARRAEAEGTAAGDANAGLFADMLLMSEEMSRGEFSDWALEEMRRHVRESPAAMAYRSCVAWFHVERGEPEAAREQLAAVLADDFGGLPFDMNWPSAMAECAEAAVGLRDPDVAAPLYRRLEPFADRHLTAGRGIVSYGSSERLLGGLAAVLGRTDAARAHFARAREHHERMGMVRWSARAARTEQLLLG